MAARSSSQSQQTDDPNEGIGDRNLFLPEGEGRSDGTTKTRLRTRLARKWLSLGSTAKLNGSGRDENQHSLHAEDHGLQQMGLTASFYPVLNFIPEDRSTTEQPQEDLDPHLSSSSDHHLPTANPIRNRTPRLETRTPRRETQIESPADPPPLTTNPIRNSATRPEEQGQKRASLSKLFQRKRIYGNKSIWHHILYGPPTGDGEDHPKSDMLFAFVLVVVLVLVTFYVTKTQRKSWPQELDTYYTDNATENIQAGSRYTCGCNLPPSLQSPEYPTADQTNLNICYEPSRRETVTVLMFSTAEKRIRQIIKENALKDYISIPEIGWKVTQEAHELTVQPGYESDLAHFYPSGVREKDVYPPIKVLRSLQFPAYSFYPYIQMFWLYDCHNCTSCGLEHVNTLSREVVNESWASCYLYGADDGCAASNSYQAKCVLYPPEALIVEFAAERFLDKLLRIPGIKNVRAEGLSSNALRVGHAALRPTILYLNSSIATDSNKIELGFVEVQKGSAAWTTLLEHYPTADTDCDQVSKVRFCNNGASVCSLFSDAQNYQVNCTDYTKPADCQSLLGRVTPDNEHLPSNSSFEERLCPANINCSHAFPYLVTWNISESGENDSLNSFLASSVLQKQWAQRSGVCTKTYRDVIRQHARKGEDSKTSGEMFLESHCAGEPKFCWTTGRYHSLSDMPGAKWAHLPDDAWNETGSKFVCYRMERQKFGDWFINFFGILFGWYGTTVLLFYALFSNWVLIRGKIRSCFGGFESTVEKVPENNIPVSSNREL